MAGDLLIFCAIQTALPDIEGAVLLTQVVKAFSVGGPNRGSVLTFEGGELGVMAFRPHPDIATSRRLVVLAEGVLGTLDTVIQHSARLAVDIQVGHGQCRVETWSSAFHTHLIELGEFSQRRDDRLPCGHVGHAEHHVLVVSEHNRGLGVATGGELNGQTAIT